MTTAGVQGLIEGFSPDEGWSVGIDETMILKATERPESPVLERFFSGYDKAFARRDGIQSQKWADEKRRYAPLSTPRQHLFSDQSHEIYSDLSHRNAVDGVAVEVRIVRLDFFPEWALEVVTEPDRSFVCNQLFDTDAASLAAFEEPATKMRLVNFLRDSGWNGPHLPAPEWKALTERPHTEAILLH